MARILIIDSDLATLHTYQSVLRARGYDVLVAASASDATSALSAGAPSLVLTELQIGNTSALTLVPSIRSQSLSIPILVTTRVSSLRSVIAAMQVGVTDFVDKPSSDQDLLRLIEQWMHRLMPGPRHLSRAMALIANGYSDCRINLRSVSRELAISPEYLCRLFKRHTGQTFCWHLAARRFAKVLELLTHEELSVKEIAIMSGFTSTAALDRAFRRRHQCSPTDYRHYIRRITAVQISARTRSLDGLSH